MGGQDRARLTVAVAAVVLLWASAFPGIRAALEAYGPGHLALLRFLFASAVLGLYAWRAGLPRPEPRDMPGLAALGVIGVAVYHAALNAGERTVTGGVASLLVSTVPVLTALLAAVTLGERLGRRGAAGVAVSLSGAVLIAVARDGRLSLDVDAGLVLLAAAAQSVYFVWQKPYLARYSPLAVTTYAVWAGTAALLVFAPGLPGAVGTAPLAATAAAVYLGLFPGALAYVAWAYALARGSASRTTAALYLVPPASIVIEWLWLGDRPGPFTLVGGALALAGVALVRAGREAAQGRPEGASCVRPGCGGSGPGSGAGAPRAAATSCAASSATASRQTSR